MFGFPLLVFLTVLSHCSPAYQYRTASVKQPYSGHWPHVCRVSVIQVFARTERHYLGIADKHTVTYYRRHQVAAEIHQRITFTFNR